MRLCVRNIGLACLAAMLLSGSALAGNLATDFLTGGGRTLVRGVVFDVEVFNEQGIVLNGFSLQIRDSSSSAGVPTEWNYRLFYRQGAFNELIDNVPAHELADAWTEVGGSASPLASPASGDFRFLPLTLSQLLPMGAGLHSFYIHATNAGVGDTTNNGLVTRNIDGYTSLVSNDDLAIFSGTSKQVLFGDAAANSRRTAISLDYTAVPEPSSWLLGLAAAGGLLGARRLRSRTGRSGS